MLLEGEEDSTRLTASIKKNKFVLEILIKTLRRITRTECAWYCCALTSCRWAWGKEKFAMLKSIYDHLPPYV